VDCRFVGPVLLEGDRLLAIDKYKFVYKHDNRREIVTVNGGEVVEEVFARGDRGSTVVRRVILGRELTC